MSRSMELACSVLFLHEDHACKAARNNKMTACTESRPDAVDKNVYKSCENVSMGLPQWLLLTVAIQALHDQEETNADCVLIFTSHLRTTYIVSPGSSQQAAKLMHAPFMARVCHCRRWDIRLSAIFCVWKPHEDNLSSTWHAQLLCRAHLGIRSALQSSAATAGNAWLGRSDMLASVPPAINLRRWPMSTSFLRSEASRLGLKFASPETDSAISSSLPDACSSCWTGWGQKFITPLTAVLICNQCIVVLIVIVIVIEILIFLILMLSLNGLDMTDESHRIPSLCRLNNWQLQWELHLCTVLNGCGIPKTSVYSNISKMRLSEAVYGDMPCSRPQDLALHICQVWGGVKVCQGNALFVHFMF